MIGGASLLVCLAGCYHMPKGSARIPSSTSSVAQAAEHDRYVYYPKFEAYYNVTRHQYVYREGRSWVDRPDLPGAWAKELASTPQVPVDFNDAPENHHAAVAQTYPANWQAESSKNTVGDAKP